MRSLAVYRTSVFFVAFAGSLALAPADGSLVCPLLFLGASMVLHVLRSRTEILPPREGRHVLALNVAFAAVALALAASSSLMSGGLRITVLLVVYLFFTARRPFSYGLVYAGAFGQVLLSALLPFHPSQLLIYAYFFAAVSFSMVLHHMLSGMRGRVASMARPDPRLDPLEREFHDFAGVNRLFFASLAAFAFVALTATAFFFLLPRLRHEQAGNATPPPVLPTPPPHPPEQPDPPPIDWPEPSGIEKTAPAEAADTGHFGFSGDVDLGQWGARFDSEREVLALYPREGARAFLRGREVYVRGLVLDRFDGRRWSRSPGLSGIGDADDGVADGLVALDTFDPADPGVTQHHVVARREFGPVRFHTGLPVGFVGDRVFVDAGGALFARRAGLAEAQTETYNVFCRPRPALDDPPRRFGPPPEEPDGRFLALPAGLDPVIEFAQVAAGAGDARKRAKNLANVLRTRCAYSREPCRCPEGTNPLAFFLFERRLGTCELFAGALAAMLRAQSIPARMVCGFLGGTVRPELDTEYVAILESDAHAWVEAWFEDGGWTRLDATPGGPARTDEGLPFGEEPEGAGPAAPEPKTDLLDYALHYDRGKQKDLMGGIASWVGQGVGAFFRGLSRVLTFLPFWVAALFAAVAAGVAWWVRERRKSAREAVSLLGHRPVAEQGRTLGFYVECLKVLQKLGHRRAPSATPAEFAREVFAADPALRWVMDVTKLFHRVRYGREAVEPAEVQAVMREVRRYRQKSRSFGK